MELLARARWSFLVRARRFRILINSILSPDCILCALCEHIRQHVQFLYSVHSTLGVCTVYGWVYAVMYTLHTHRMYIHACTKVHSCIYCIYTRAVYSTIYSNVYRACKTVYSNVYNRGCNCILFTVLHTVFVYSIQGCIPDMVTSCIHS